MRGGSTTLRQEPELLFCPNNENDDGRERLSGWGDWWIAGWSRFPSFASFSLFSPGWAWFVWDAWTEWIASMGVSANSSANLPLAGLSDLVGMITDGLYDMYMAGTIRHWVAAGL